MLIILDGLVKNPKLYVFASFVSEPGTVLTAVAMIGKFCITATFAIIYMYSAEIFPTVVR